MAIVAVLFVIGVVLFCSAKFGWGIKFYHILLVLAGLAGLYYLAVWVSGRLFGRHNRMLAEKHGIQFLESGAAQFKKQLSSCSILPDHGLAVQVNFYIKTEGDFQAAVFAHCWSTGFGDGRREHVGVGFVADLTDITAISSDDILGLLGTDTDLKSESCEGGFVVFSESSGHQALRPENILEAVCDLYRRQEKGASGEAQGMAG